MNFKHDTRIISHLFAKAVHIVFSFPRVSHSLSQAQVKFSPWYLDKFIDPFMEPFLG